MKVLLDNIGWGAIYSKCKVILYYDNFHVGQQSSVKFYIVNTVYFFIGWESILN